MEHLLCGTNIQLQPYISVTIVFIVLKTRIWHTQNKCTDFFQGIMNLTNRQIDIVLIFFQVSICACRFNHVFGL